MSLKKSKQKKLVRLHLATYFSCQSTALVWLTGRHVTLLVTNVTTIDHLGNHYWQFNLKISRASCCGLKHSPGPTTCLNHTKFHKEIMCGTFYLRATAGWPRNIKLTGHYLYGTLYLFMFTEYCMLVVNLPYKSMVC